MAELAALATALVILEAPARRALRERKRARR